MKLKKVLCVTFFSVTVLPIILFLIVIFVANLCQVNIFQKSVDIDNVSCEEMQNSVQMLSNLTRNIHRDIEKVAKENPDKLTDISYLSDLNGKLEKKSSFLIVRQEDIYVYIGDNEQESDWDTYLPEYVPLEDAVALDGGFYVGGNLQALVKKVDFITSEGTTGSAYIITKLNSLNCF